MVSKNINLTLAEEKLSEIIWQNAPMTSPELVLLADSKLGWKKSTTYTVLKKLCDKGVFKNDNANLFVILTRDELTSRQSQSFVEEVFGGSLPKFIASFISGKSLTTEQATELHKLIDEHERSGHNG